MKNLYEILPEYTSTSFFEDGECEELNIQVVRIHETTDNWAEHFSKNWRGIAKYDIIFNWIEYTISLSLDCDWMTYNRNINKTK